MLHFVTSYMNQDKSRKQTLESAQYGLEISFKKNLKRIDSSCILNTSRERVPECGDCYSERMVSQCPI